MDNAGFILVDRYDRLYEKYNKSYEEFHYILMKENWIKKSNNI